MTTFSQYEDLYRCPACGATVRMPILTSFSTFRGMAMDPHVERFLSGRALCACGVEFPTDEAESLGRELSVLAAQAAEEEAREKRGLRGLLRRMFRRSHAD